MLSDVLELKNDHPLAWKIAKGLDRACLGHVADAKLLCHFLAALAYFHKTVANAPENFNLAGHGVRPPLATVHNMAYSATVKL